jgi:hypothetical protein
MIQLLCLYFNPCGLNADLLPDEDGLDDIYISEMLSSKTGWNKLFVVDEIIRDYADEMQDPWNA